MSETASCARCGGPHPTEGADRLVATTPMPSPNGAGPTMQRGPIPPPDHPVFAPPHRDAPILVPLDKVEPRTVEWVWRDRLPTGYVAVYAGDPGLGKSWLTHDAAARISTGTPWPDGTPCPRGDVIVLSAEDGPEDVIVPHLTAMEADLSRVHVLRAIRIKGGAERGFDIMRDVRQLHAACDSIEAAGGHLVAVSIDPLSAYIGAADSHVNAQMRGGVFAPLARFAEERRVVVICVEHMNKASQMKAIYRVGGSIAIVGAPRAAFAIVPADPEQPDNRRRLFAALKSNLAPKPPTLAFSIGGEPPRVLWERDPVPNADVDSILRGPEPEERGERTARERASALLREMLASGPRPSREVDARADHIGISHTTLKRAKVDVGTDADEVRDERGRVVGWLLRLSSQKPISPEEALVLWSSGQIPKEIHQGSRGPGVQRISAPSGDEADDPELQLALGTDPGLPPWGTP